MSQQPRNYIGNDLLNSALSAQTRVALTDAGIGKGEEERIDQSLNDDQILKLLNKYKPAAQGHLIPNDSAEVKRKQEEATEQSEVESILNKYLVDDENEQKRNEEAQKDEEEYKTSLNSMDFYLTQGGATKKQSLEQYTRKLQPIHVRDNSEPAADILSDLP